MAPRTQLSLLALAALLAVVSAAPAPACGKLRLQWMYTLPPGTKPADVLAANRVFLDKDCTTAVGSGEGAAALPLTPTVPPGTKTPPPYGVNTATVTYADVGGYIDFATLADLKTCFGNGAKSGNLAAVRKFAKQASRVVYELPACTGAPAGVRDMFNYKLSEVTPVICKKVVSLEAKVKGTPAPVREAAGCDALNGDTSAFGAKNLPVTANFGGFADFKNMADFAAFLDSAAAKPASKAALDEARSMGSVMRMAFNLAPAPSAAKVAKERGAIAP